MIKNSTINDRILYIIENEFNNNQKKFSESIGFSAQVVFNIVSGRKSKPSYDVIEAIISTNDNINPEWLLTGKGSMFKSSKDESKIIAERITDFSIKIESDLIPITSISAAAGFGGEGFSIHQRDIEDYCKIPHFKGLGVEFMVPVVGVSMLPIYSPGDLVACKIIKNRDFIQWSKPHVIATREQGLLLKRIKKSETPGYITAISDNKEYDPFDIPESEITGIALVLGGIKFE